MPLKAKILPELPYLRRYARAITGSQKLGDASVREVLEALLEAPHEFNLDAPARQELYRIYHKLWRSGLFADLGDPLAGNRLDPVMRQMLLLSTVEGFSTADTGIIMDRSEDEVRHELAVVRDVIANELKSTVVVIEDEPVIALHIKTIVEEVGHKVLGIARTHREAVAMVESTAPEIILADINLADGSSGLDAVNDILAVSAIPVIFVTAYPERLLTGTKPEPTYLITKPFDPPVLVAMIAQAAMFERERAEMTREAA